MTIKELKELYAKHFTKVYGCYISIDEITDDEIKSFILDGGYNENEISL